MVSCSAVPLVAAKMASMDESDPVLGAAEEMTRDELERAVEALGARERELLLAGDVASAREIALDKWLCLSVLRKYG